MKHKFLITIIKDDNEPMVGDNAKAILDSLEFYGCFENVIGIEVKEIVEGELCSDEIVD